MTTPASDISYIPAGDTVATDDDVQDALAQVAAATEVAYRRLGAVTIDYTGLAPLTSAEVLAAVDPAQLAVPFICPPSGCVRVRLTAGCWVDTAGGAQLWLVVDSISGKQLRHAGCTATGSTSNNRVTMEYDITEFADGTPLVPGTAYNFVWWWGNLGTGATVKMDNALVSMDVTTVDGPSPVPRIPAVTVVQSPASTAAAGASASVSFASAPTAGNLLVAFVGANVASAGNWSMPSGWTRVEPTDESASTKRIGTYVRVADGTEGTSPITFTATGSTLTYLHLAELGGFRSTPTVDVVAGYSFSSASSFSLAATGTTANPQEVLVAYWATSPGNTISGGGLTSGSTGFVMNDAAYAAAASILNLAATGKPRIQASVTTAAAAAAVLFTISGA